MTPETKYKSQVKRFLDDNNIYHFPYSPGMFGKAGIPDTIICHKGLFIAVEFKADGGKLAPIQKVKIDEINREGGIAFTLYPAAFGVFKELLLKLIHCPVNSWEFHETREKLIRLGR